MWRPTFYCKTGRCSRDRTAARDFIENAMAFRAGKWAEWLKHIVTDVSGEACSTQMQLPIADDRASDPRSNKDAKGIAASDGSAHFQFTVHRRMKVVPDRDPACADRRQYLLE